MREPRRGPPTRRRTARLRACGLVRRARSGEERRRPACQRRPPLQSRTRESSLRLQAATPQPRPSRIPQASRTERWSGSHAAAPNRA
ncbi:MAG: hypothetical protein AMJ62_12885 [Myxococcales bacterium SG8_38]|nr:MAG: hypothetical protein AMJ62_12885 [Myxococcales bacterium SG8_38]